MQPIRTNKKEEVIFISLYGENDKFRNKPEYEEEPESIALSESVEIPLDSPIKQPDDNDASSPQQTSANIVCTDATIEHHRRSVSRCLVTVVSMLSVWIINIYSMYTGYVDI